MNPRVLPLPGSQEASDMLDVLLAEYNWPANSKNAARAGWEAANRWLCASGDCTFVAGVTGTCSRGTLGCPWTHVDGVASVRAPLSDDAHGDEPSVSYGVTEPWPTGRARAKARRVILWNLITELVIACGGSAADFPEDITNKISAIVDRVGAAQPALPTPDGYVAMTPDGSHLVPPQEFAAANCYAIFTAEQMRALRSCGDCCRQQGGVMPVFNFDLEDGKQPVTFSLSPEDAPRFMNFMAQCNGDLQDAARYRYLRRTTTAVHNSKGDRVEVTPGMMDSVIDKNIAAASVKTLDGAKR